MTDLKDQETTLTEPVPVGTSTGRKSTRRPYRESSKFADRKLGADGNVEAALQEQLQDDRFAEMKADLSYQYLENLPIPNYGDMVVPGYKLITRALANEYGLVGAGEEEEGGGFEDWPIDETPTPAPAAAVNGNLIETFVENIAGQHLHDVLNATLLAQLAANRRYNRAEEPVPWTQFYGNVLENIGWVVPSFDFRQMRSSATRFSIDSAVLKVITALLTAEGVEVVKAAFEALESLNGEDRRLAIWRRNSCNLNNGNFQINGVAESAAGVLQMVLSAYHVRTNEAVTDVLWFRFNSGSTDLRATRTTLVLNDQVYDRLRDAVLNKLGDRGLNFIGDLELGDV